MHISRKTHIKPKIKNTNQKNQLFNEQLKELVLYFSSIEDDNIRNKSIQLMKLTMVANENDNFEYLHKIIKLLNKTNSVALKDKIIEMCDTFVY